MNAKSAGKRIRRKPGRPLATTDFDSREALLRATHDLLTESRGLPVPISAICERAHVNLAMVNYHFGSKKNLTVAIFERLCESLHADLENLLRLDITPRKKLEIHIRQLIRQSQKSPYASRIMTELLMSTRHALATRLGNKFVQPLTSFYGRLIAQGVAAGEFQPVDPMFLFFTIVGQSEYLFASHPLLAAVFGVTAIDDKFENAFIEHTTRLVLDGMCGRSQRQCGRVAT